MGKYADLLAEVRGPTRELRQAIPEAWAGFGALHNATMADGAVPTRIKEAVALAIAVVKRCDGCVAYHARAAARAGATWDEIAEVLAVALLMDGGTASVYAPKAWEAFMEFSAPAVVAAPAQSA